MSDGLLTDSDRELIDAAKQALYDRFEPGRFRTSCGLLTESGEIYTSINLVTTIGAAETHCEPIAVGMAIMDGHTEFSTSVAVNFPEDNPEREPQVVSACGVCRELLWDIAPGIDVIVPGAEGPEKVALTELLPAKG